MSNGNYLRNYKNALSYGNTVKPRYNTVVRVHEFKIAL